MIEKLEFPMTLDSYQGNSPDQYEKLTFQNYFPKSKELQETATIVPVNDEYHKLAQQTKKRMKEMNVQNMLASGKINIYPKKNTIDLKKHLEKKTIKL